MVKECLRLQVYYNSLRVLPRGNAYMKLNNTDADNIAVNYDINQN